jgi:hypothetical protein
VGAGYRGKKSLSWEATMEIDGSCHCGAIAYEAIVDPKAAALCHCADCRTLSGSLFRASVSAKAENFRILRGQPKIYVKTADSGAKRFQCRLFDCQSPIFTLSRAALQGSQGNKASYIYGSIRR